MSFLLKALSSGMSALKLKIRSHGLRGIECGLNSDEMCLLECMLSSGKMGPLEQKPTSCDRWLYSTEIEVVDMCCKV